MIQPRIPDFVNFIVGRLARSNHTAYIVGGAVRDSFLKRAVTDWDVATSATGIQIKSIFHDIKLFSLSHGTVTLVDGGHLFEVTPFKGHKNLIDEDLKLRDFTIDAMAYDPFTNEILDLNDGQKDLKGRIIRAVAEPEACFRADPLRLLRAVRLATELGFRIEPKTLETITNMSLLLRSAAVERIREELMKVLTSPKPSSGFNLMTRTGLLKCFLPELLEGYLVRQNTYHRFTIFKHVMETLDKVDPTPILRLTALLHDIAKPRVRKKVNGQWRFYSHEQASAELAGEIMNRLRFSTDTCRRVTNLISNHMIRYDPEWGDGAVRRLIRRVGTNDIKDLILFRRADILGHGLHDDDLLLLNGLERRIKQELKRSVPFDTKHLAIDGKDVMKTLGLSPGPKVGKVLNNLMEKVIDHPELNDMTTLLKLLKTNKNNIA